MDKIKIKIDGRVAEIESAPEVVTDNTEYEVEFAVDERDGWNPAVPMTALFVRRDARYTAVVMDVGETICTMPPQTGTNIVYVGLTQDDMRTTTPAAIKVHRSIRTVAHDPLPEPTEDVYAQILAAYAGIKILSGKGAPTSATQGNVNQLYRDEDTQKLYICTATAGGYTWAAVVSDTEDAVTYTAQTLTEEQKTQARANIGAGTSNFSGLYNDLPDKPNIPAATVIDTTLSKSGQAADAKAAGDAIEKKIDKAQGTGNAGKILGIGADGNVTPQDKPVQALAGPSAPTTATAGVVGQEYYIILGNAVAEMYVCTAVANGTYTWGKVDMPEQVQADWNQNNNTAADYVKNRTHYEESTYTDYVLNMSGTEIVGFSMPEVGETMTVKINGVESAETVKEAESSIIGGSYKYIGNIDIDSMINGGIGWIVWFYTGTVSGFANPDTEISVESIVVHKINDKFINFDGFVRTFDYHFKTGAIYKTLYKDNGDACILYMCDNFITPETDSQLFGFMSELGFSYVRSTSPNGCFVNGYIIKSDGNITVKNVILGTDTGEMELIAASYGYTLTTNPNA